LVTEIVTEEDTGHAALRPEVVDRCINETYAKEGIRVIQPTVPQEGGGPVSPIPVGDDKCLVTLFVPANEATFSVPGREGDTPVCRGVIIQVNGEDVVEGLLTGTGYGVPVSAWVGFLPGDDSAV
jgi:hypothetical protein